MPRVFAEHFLVPTHEPDHEAPTLTYDEARALNLAADGRVFVELRTVGDTHTLTEVRAEREDHDPQDFVAPTLETTTKIAREAEDVVPAEALLGTDTRRGAEEEDRAPESLLGTKTDAIQQEAEDFVTADALLGTETFARGESEDVDPVAWSGANTAVNNEAEDFELDVMRFPGEIERP
jgi:hypothetical protein